MAVTEVATYSANKLLNYLPSLVIRHWWPERRLGELTVITVDGQGEGIRVDAGEHPNFVAFLTITNLSPFKLDIDRLHGVLYCCPGPGGPYVLLSRPQIQPYSIERVHVEGQLTPSHANHLKANTLPDSVRLTLDGYVHCSARSFHLLTREINCCNVRFMNANERRLRVAS